MEQSTSYQLTEIKQALCAGGVTAETAHIYLEQCIDSLLRLEVISEEQQRELLQAYLPLISQLTALLPDNCSDVFYYRSIMSFIQGNYQSYLVETEKYYSAKSHENPDWLDWYAADYHFVAVLGCLPTLGEMSDKIVTKVVHTYQKLTTQYFPQSAFDLYCKSWMTKGSEQHRLRLLKDVLCKDASWAAAWTDSGDIYYQQGKWAQALDAYRHGMEDARTHTANLLFSAAWSAGQLKDLDTELQYYRECVELDPAFPYAQNNLGGCLNRKNCFVQAEPYLRYAVEHDEEKKKPCRNLFKTLEQLGKIDDLYNLVQKYPEHFQTKYYRERLKKIAHTRGLTDLTELQALLEKTTTNDYAGCINVSPDQSGIRLYQHQKDAVQKLDGWKRQGNSGAGLLVLPTGGGKTLTATYWLMKSILDQGGKVLWIAHRQELLDQALAAFKKVCYQDLSPHKQGYQYRVVSGRHDKAVHIRPEDDILIASKSSLTHDLSHIQRKWIMENKNQICRVIGEAHHAPASEYRKLIQTVQEYGGNFRLLGLTATPLRTAEKEQGLLSKLFPDDILYKVDLRTLINQGILSEPDFHFTVNTNIKMADLFHAENADGILERIVNEKGFDIGSPGAPSMEAARLIASHSERNRLIVDTYVKNKSTFQKTIVFAVNVDMAIALNKLFQERGIRSEYVVSSLRDSMTGASRSDEENKIIIQKFRDGQLDVLVNVNILTEGIDLPQAQTVFLTRPTKSTILMTQMIGRALRGEKAGGTAKAYIVSFIDDWQEYIAWVNPEKLFIDTNADFTNRTAERKAYIMRLVSIAKLEEFAKLADDNLDDGIGEQFTFLERIPVGLYQFTYLPDGEDESRNCTVLVYDCMQEAYSELLRWMEDADLSDLDAAASHVDETLFGEKDRLLGYHFGDVRDILAFYQQTGAKPQWIPLEERAEYDVVELSNHIIANRLDMVATDQYLKDEWNQAGEKWSAFFGYHNYKAFRKAVRQECDRLIDGPEPPTTAPITKQESIQIQDLPLGEIRRRFPAIWEKLRDAIFAKFQSDDGYYFSAESGHRSKSRLDFQIDHIKPMSKGGKTTLDNLQLLTRQENGIKGDQF